MFTPIMNFVGEITRSHNWAAPVVVLGLLAIGVSVLIYVWFKHGHKL